MINYDSVDAQVAADNWDHATTGKNYYSIMPRAELLRHTVVVLSVQSVCLSVTSISRHASLKTKR